MEYHLRHWRDGGKAQPTLRRHVSVGDIDRSHRRHTEDGSSQEEYCERPPDFERADRIRFTPSEPEQTLNQTKSVVVLKSMEPEETRFTYDHNEEVDYLLGVSLDIEDKRIRN